MEYLKNTRLSLQKGVSNKTGNPYTMLVVNVKNDKTGINHQENIFLSNKEALLTLMEMAEK